MKREEANILLQKYFEAETTLAEEASLVEYFTQETLPDEMIPFKIWFEKLGRDATHERDLRLENEMMEVLLQRDQNRKKRVLWMSLTGIAASLLIALGAAFYFQQQNTYRDSFDDPAAALACATKTLHFVSANYNKGLAQLKPVHKITTATLPVARSLRCVEKGFTEFDKIHIMKGLLK